MAAGEYVSVSSQADSEKADLDIERRELAANPEGEQMELADIYVQRGLDPALAQQVATQLTRHDALGGARARRDRPDTYPAGASGAGGDGFCVGVYRRCTCAPAGQSPGARAMGGAGRRGDFAGGTGFAWCSRCSDGWCLGNARCRPGNVLGSACHGLHRDRRQAVRRGSVSRRVQCTICTTRAGIYATPSCTPMSGVLLTFCRFSVTPKEIRNGYAVTETERDLIFEAEQFVQIGFVVRVHALADIALQIDVGILRKCVFVAEHQRGYRPANPA